jgi:hypothetical protein
MPIGREDAELEGGVVVVSRVLLPMEQVVNFTKRAHVLGRVRGWCAHPCGCLQSDLCAEALGGLARAWGEGTAPRAGILNRATVGMAGMRTHALRATARLMQVAKETVARL